MLSPFLSTGLNNFHFLILIALLVDVFASTEYWERSTHEIEYTLAKAKTMC